MNDQDTTNNFENNDFPVIKRKNNQQTSGSISSNDIDPDLTHNIETIDSLKTPVPILEQHKTGISEETPPKTENNKIEKKQTAQKNEAVLVSNKKQNWIKNKTKTKSSNIVLIPGIIIAIITYFIPALIPNIDLIVFSQEELNTLPEGIQKNMNGILNFLIYAVGAASLAFAIKAKSKGSLSIFDTYVIHKKGILSKNKILIPNIISIEIHHSPFSLFGNIGNLEITSTKGDIFFENCPDPELIKEEINYKRLNYKGNIS